MSSTTVAVPGIHCDHCKQSIEGALRTMPGVRSADVSVPDRSVAVDYDDSVVDLDAIRNAIIEQGYVLPA